jgi:hypothetical protein
LSDSEKEIYLQDNLRRYVTFSTTGNLSLTSTRGDVTVNAPIPDTTGEVAITAGDAIVVNHKVFSDDRPITLIAGPGGITVNSTTDDYGILSGGLSPAIDSGTGDMMLQSVGDVLITTSNGIATDGKLTIDTRGKIIDGMVNQNWVYVPSEIELIADGGIVSFDAGYSPKISAKSTGIFLNGTLEDPGDIHLDVYHPDQLFITAKQGSVFTGNFIGIDVNIYAGNDINLSNIFEGGTLKLTAGNYANLGAFYYVNSLDVTAGSNISFSSGGLSSPEATVWLNGGDLNVKSNGGSISFGSNTDYSAIHIGGEKDLTLSANGNIEIGILEMFGDVSITAQTGNITLRNDIGPPIQYYNPTKNEYYPSYPSQPTYPSDLPADYIPPSPLPVTWPDESDPLYSYYLSYNSYRNNLAAYNTFNSIYYGTVGSPSFDPDGTGVASLMLNAGSNINMQGAKATGAVTITAGGTLTPNKGIYSGTQGGVKITTSNVTVSFADAYGSVSLDTQAQLVRKNPPLPVASPGPSVAPPGVPNALTALPALPPDLANVSGTGIPAASGADDEITEIEVEPVRVAGSGSLSEIIPDDNVGTEDEEEREKILEFAGGRGIAQATDFGRR